MSRRAFRIACTTAPLLVAAAIVAGARAPQRGHAELVALFEEFRAFERPSLEAGAPDYTASTLAEKHRRLKSFQSRLASLNPRRGRSINRSITPSWGR